MIKQMRRLIEDYKKSINPPYSRKDHPIIGATLLILLLAAALVVILPNRFKSEQTKKSSAQEALQQPSVPDEILLRFKPGASEKIKDNVRKAYGISKKEDLKDISVELVKVHPKARDKVIEALKKREEVDFAEENLIVKPQIIPNDPQYSQQWHLAKILAPAAWDLSKATGTLIAICDTGVNSVPDLSAVLRGDLGWNAVDGTNNWADNYGHGTMTAGAAAAAANNGVGVAGVAWGAQIIPIRISNQTDGSAFTSDAAKCINYAADHGARAINLSYGMGSSLTIDSAGQYAQSKGALTTVAAGNSSTNLDIVSSLNTYPWPNLPGFLAVSGTNDTDSLASWSNYGSFIDVAAPGVSIMTTLKDGTYYYFSGTSASSPVAAGVIGLIFGAKPSLTAAQAQSVLLNNSDDIGDSGYDIKFGYGRVDALRAVNESLGLPPDTSPPTVSITSPVNGATVGGKNVTVVMSALDNFGVSKTELYVDGTLVARSISSSYSYYWDSRTVTNGTHVLTARAYDGTGNVGSSAPISINVSNSSDTTDPVISITNPLAGSTVSGLVNISADVTDNVGVSYVTINAGGVFLMEFKSPPYTVSWDTTTLPDGNATVGVNASDAAGNFVQKFITVTVKNGISQPTNTPTPTVVLPTPTNTPIPSPTPTSSDTTSPSVSITSPLNGSTVAVRSTVSIQASASDNIGITRVEFYVNGTLSCSDTSSPYTCSWKVPGAKNKSYTLMARAYDAAGNSSTSSITITAK
jgi:thermitase